jgi:UDP-N-acetylglucosamine--dolichyl-phosphate N-acetylglucosaminephosphotransferase
MFPKVPDQHKQGKPLIPNGIGVLYVLFTTVYLFLLYFLSSPTELSGPLTLAVCVLFGGFMGLLDDWMDLKWRYKAFMPLIAALPLISFALLNNARTTISLPFLGTIDFGLTYFYIIIPLIVMIITNTVNQLGGLNGLETLCPAIVIAGLMIASSSYVLMLGPLVFWLILTALNLRGKIFVGNSGSFAIGLTIASFAVITDLKLNLAISMIPYIFNSALILIMIFLTHHKAKMQIVDGKLVSDAKRSLITLIVYKRPLTERKVVAIIAGTVAVFTFIAGLIQLFS